MTTLAPKPSATHPVGGSTPRLGPATPSLGIAASIAATLVVAGAGALQAQTSAGTQDGRVPAGARVVEVSAEDYAFRVPAEIPSGWTTLRFTNQGEEHHFMLLVRLPDDRTFDEYATQVTAPFNDVWYPLRDGDIGPDEAVARIYEILPEWYGGVQAMGGPGLLAPGRTGEVTLNLAPGRYVVECYMKTPEGEFHAMEGMLDPIRVTDSGAEGAPPTADLRVTLASSGLQLEGAPALGRQVIEVHYADHPEGTLGHDVQLVRLDAAGEVDDVVSWLNWLEVPGLMEPAPAPFVGGINQMPVGTTAYFTVDLEPGRYMLVSEYTGAMGVLAGFTVER